MRNTTARPTAPRRARPAKRVAIAARSVASFLTLLPLGANANETCQRLELVTPAQYETKTITATYEAHDQLFVVPAVFGEFEIEVNVTPLDPNATCQQGKTRTIPTRGPMKIVPTSFNLVKQKDGSRRYLVNKPAHVFRTPSKITTKIIQRTCTPVAKMNPLKSYTIRRKVIKTPAYVRSEWVPERTETITERVVVESARISILQESCDN